MSTPLPRFHVSLCETDVSTGPLYPPTDLGCLALIAGPSLYFLAQGTDTSMGSIPRIACNWFGQLGLANQNTSSQSEVLRRQVQQEGKSFLLPLYFGPHCRQCLLPTVSPSLQF
jgi:hypothetical protein